jgi:hypothetical protein
VFDRPPELPPYLFSYTAGSILYQDIVGLALGLHMKSDLEKDTVADSQDSTVKYQHSILAKAPGSERDCRDHILEAHREMIRSEEYRVVESSYRELDKLAVKARQAVDGLGDKTYTTGDNPSD